MRGKEGLEFKLFYYKLDNLSVNWWGEGYICFILYTLETIAIQLVNFFREQYLVLLCIWVGWLISVTFWVPFSLGRGLRGYNFGIILRHINNSLIVPAIAKSVKRIVAFVDAMRFCKYSILHTF